MRWTFRTFLFAFVVFFSMFGCDKPPEVVNPPKPRDTSEDATRARTTRNLYFVIDGSGSMGDSPSQESKDPRFEGKSKLEGAKIAVADFLQKVPQNCNLGLFVFDSYGQREVVPLGANNREAFLTAVQAIKAGSGTPLGSSITFGVNQLKIQSDRQLGYGEFRLVVVTDGESDSGDPVPPAIELANSYSFPVYTIGFCVSNQELQKLSFKYFQANSSEALNEGLNAALAEPENFDAVSFKK